MAPPIGGHMNIQQPQHLPDLSIQNINVGVKRQRLGISEHNDEPNAASDVAMFDFTPYREIISKRISLGH